MTLEITVGPPQLTINQGYTVMISELDGEVPFPSDKGLYFRDTRMLSAYMIQANGLSWELLNAGATTYFAARSYLTNPVIPTEGSDIPARTLQLVLSRTVAGGMHEDLDLTNQSGQRVSFNLEVLVRSDFADIFEVKSGRIVRRGRITTHWFAEESELTTTYRNRDFARSLILRARCQQGDCVYANGRLSFAVALDPGESWHACLEYILTDGEERHLPPTTCYADASESAMAHDLASWKSSVLKLHTSNEEFYRLYHQSIEDIAALRLPVRGSEHTRFILAAGVPWFVALFGRDSLIVALQTMMIYPDFARGALDMLGEQQSRERDEYRDAEPGKILHEMRQGELARLKLIPHTPYFGTADATLLYMITFHAAWRSTGDRTLLDRLLPVAERCLEWMEKYGDSDGDGFQEYQTYSPKGYENMAWKDAGDSVMYPDGTLVRGPKALCELQGYAYDAMRRMADIYDAVGRADDAARLREKAAALYARFNEEFWDEEAGCYAYCLDGEKLPVLSVASNVGHLLWSGIVPVERAARLVARLMAPDMWSGWGIRTLSSEHAAYNPLSYQNGSVWPHDNGMIAMGFKRYGFGAEAASVARDISGAAGFFMLHRLPELYAGISREDGTNFPVQYLGANVPQAWAAGTAFTLLQALLGLQPDAPNRKLYVDPMLPDWIEDVTLRDLQIGNQVFDIAFQRQGEETVFEVLRGDPGNVIRVKPGTDPLA